MTDTFFTDISSWQRPVDHTYPHPILSFRVDTGGGIDSNAEDNWTFARGAEQIKVAIGYVVFKPGQGHAIFDRAKSFFGSKAPAKLVVMVDMESGSQFAGPGNHSVEANELVELFAIWLGSRKRVLGYANHYDWQSCWPQAPTWLKRFTASYGTADPGSFGWQYYGGVAANPSPPGYPRSCRPFGSNVDLNVIHLPVAAIVEALGLAPAKFPPNHPRWSETVNQDEIRAVVREEQEAALHAVLQGGDHGFWTAKSFPKLVRAVGEGVLDRLNRLERKAGK